jgi:hypothetical protein
MLMQMHTRNRPLTTGVNPIISDWRHLESHFSHYPQGRWYRPKPLLPGQWWYNLPFPEQVYSLKLQEPTQPLLPIYTNPLLGGHRRLLPGQQEFQDSGTVLDPIILTTPFWTVVRTTRTLPTVPMFPFTVTDRFILICLEEHRRLLLLEDEQ